jgi:hypothetical protein
MTFTQMRSEAELLYESINSSLAPGFTDSEWGQLLTIAQRKVVEDILKEGISKNAFNMLAIEKLVNTASYLVFVANTHFKNSNGTSAFALSVVMLQIVIYQLNGFHLIFIELI